MVRYFLNVDLKDGFIPDTEGLDFIDLERATAEVISGMRDIIVEHIQQGEALALRAISITDDAGHLMSIVTLADALNGFLPGMAISGFG
jgi:glycerol-3-phosphate responsive antiterminator